MPVGDAVDVARSAVRADDATGTGGRVDATERHPAISVRRAATQHEGCGGLRAGEQRGGDHARCTAETSHADHRRFGSTSAGLPT